MCMLSLHKETISYYVHTAFLNVTQCSSHVKTSNQRFQKEANIRTCGVTEQVRNNVFNPLTPNVNYSGRTAPLTSKVAFYIFIQQI